jgi:plasmid stabilization system protein ParE
MAFEIRWTNRAASNLDKIVNYLLAEWGERSVIKLLNRIKGFLDVIKEKPLVGKIEIEESNLRSFVLSRHNTLLYRLKGNTIILIALIDNRQERKKRI